MTPLKLQEASGGLYHCEIVEAGFDGPWARSSRALISLSTCFLKAVDVQIKG